MLGPLLEHTTPAPHRLDHRTEAAVTTRRQPFDQRRLRVVPLQLDAAVTVQRVAQQADLAAELRDGVLAEPLERRERLRHETADGHRDRRALVIAAADLDAVAGELRDAERVLVGLGRQAGEEVQLHAPPALRVGGLDRAEQVVLGDELVDHLAHAPRSRLGREREARAPSALDLRGDADGERVDAQARQAHADVAAAAVGVVRPCRARRPRCPEKSAVDSDVSATSS